MRIADFELYRELLERHAGLALEPEKSYLLDSRLTPVARKWGYPTMEAMTLALRGVPDVSLLGEVLEALTSGDTAFFRDTEPFSFLRDDVLPALIKSKGRNRTLRIWSAGCSTGQEPYSIAMVLKDIEHQLKGWKVQILATDISQLALTKAKTGNYTQFEVQRGLPISHLLKYFTEMDDSWRLQPALRDLVVFEQHNLLEPYDEFGLFDVIFCRNVLSGFEHRRRQTVLANLTEALTENGCLVLGFEERLGDSPDLNALQGCPGFYGRTKGPYAFAAAKQAV